MKNGCGFCISQNQIGPTIFSGKQPRLFHSLSSCSFTDKNKYEQVCSVPRKFISIKDKYKCGVYRLM